MDIKRPEAEASLRLVQQSQLQAERHSLNNGVYMMVWGIIIILALATYDLFPPTVAGLVMTAILFAGAGWSVLYARGIKVQPRRPKIVPVFLVTMGIYYPLVLFGGIWLFPQRPPALFTTIGVLTAAPLLIVGLRLWLRVREAR